MRRRGRTMAAIGGMIVAAVAATAALAGGPPVRSYEVTITNLTGGQPLTPPVLATHRGAVDVFTVGRPASTGVQEIAENGNLDPLLDALGGNKHVYDVATGGAPLVPNGLPGSVMFPDDSVTLTVEAAAGARLLSWVSMLICTNDGFTGVDSLPLPKHVGQSTTVTTNAYDAGTEKNTEYFGDIVPPCQVLVGPTGDPGTGASDPALAEGGVIQHHAGVVGGVNLMPTVHGWSDPVAMLTVERIG